MNLRGAASGVWEPRALLLVIFIGACASADAGRSAAVTEDAATAEAALPQAIDPHLPSTSDASAAVPNDDHGAGRDSARPLDSEVGSSPEPAPDAHATDGDGNAGTEAGASSTGSREGGVEGSTPPHGTYAVQFADTILRRWPDPRNITGVTRGWDYNNGIVLRGMAEVYRATHDARYLAYIQRYVDVFVDSAGRLYVDAARSRAIENEAHSLDLIQPAQLLLFLIQEKAGDGRYAAAASTVRGTFAKFPVNSSGGFWHKATTPNEMWLDGIYMAEPFLAGYGLLTPACGAYCADTPVAQATLIGEHTRLPSGLFAHGWDADKNASWCTGLCAGAGAGRSNEVWGRAIGWYAMALVDVLSSLPPSHAGRPALVANLSALAQALKSAQDPATGLWCEVVDKCSQGGNWAESSGSGMMIYALKRGIAQGALDGSYLAVAERAWKGLVAKIGHDASGPTIDDAADGSSIVNTYDDYVAIPRRSNSYHGLCAIQLAAAAMEYDGTP